MENKSNCSNSSLKIDQMTKSNFTETSLMSGKSFCFSFKNMLLKQIPTQMTRIYIKIKVGKSKSITSSVPIINNVAEWNDKIKLNWKSTLNKKSSKRSLKIRFSFRFENISGRGFTRYGNAEIDLLHIQQQSLNNWEFSSKLCDCNYDSTFSCHVFIDQKFLSSLKDDKAFLKNTNSEFINRIDNFYGYSSIITRNDENRNFDELLLIKSTKKNERVSGSKNSSFYLPTIYDFNDSSESNEEKLPFIVNQDKMNLLKYQVDGIIMKVLQQK